MIRLVHLMATRPHVIVTAVAAIVLALSVIVPALVAFVPALGGAVVAFFYSDADTTVLYLVALIIGGRVAYVYGLAR